MNAITTEYLKEKGFIDNHPERVLHKLYKHTENPGYRVVLEQTYDPITNHVSYKVDMFSTDEFGNIVKEGSLKTVDTIEEFNTFTNLFNVNI